MPRASRNYIPGQIWHITHRCHNRKALLRFNLDRRNWLFWLSEAKKRYGLKVLDYTVMMNHIHLLLLDSQFNAIPRSMQLIASKTAQAYNHRHQRKGAFWEDRYHATAVAADTHLYKCLVYIDLNIVRAGVVYHPGQWQVSGYVELQQPRGRRPIIARKELLRLLDCTSESEFRTFHRGWIENQLNTGMLKREPGWTEAIAYGTLEHIKQVKEQLLNTTGNRLLREIQSGSDWILKEENAYYG
jgi:putative transposase